MKRGLAIAIVYVALILFPVLIGAILVPPVVEQLNNLIQNLPAYAADLQDFVNENERLRAARGGLQHHGGAAEAGRARCPAGSATRPGSSPTSGSGSSTRSSPAVTILVLSLFMIGSGRNWLRLARGTPGAGARGRGSTGCSTGSATRSATTSRARSARRSSPGVLAYIVLTILGVPYAGSLAVIIFLLDLVPLVGATLGAILVGIITLFNDFPTTTIIWTIWSIVYQQVENNVIQPRIQARAVQVRAVRRPDLGALRLDAVRRARRAAGDPGRRRDPDLDHRVQQLPPAREHRRRAGAAGDDDEATARAAPRRRPSPRPPRAGSPRPPRRRRPRRRGSRRSPPGSSGRPSRSMRSAAASSATPSAAMKVAAASRAASVRSGPSSARERVAHHALDLAEELRAAGADGRDLEGEPALDAAGRAPSSRVSGRSQSRTAGIVAGASRSCIGERGQRERRVAEDDVLLRGEVGEDRGARDVGRLGDLLHRRRREAVLGEQPHAGVVDRLARGVLLALPQSGSCRHHTPSIIRLS